MKKVVAILFIAFSLIIGAQAQGAQLVDKVIARVGSEYILLSDVEDELLYVKKNKPGITDDYKCKILENLITQKMIIYQAKLDSVEVKDEEIDLELDTRFERILASMNGDEEFFKEYYGATVPEMKERYRDDQRQQILAQTMQQQLMEKVKITPKEVAEFYNQIPKDSLPFLNSEVELAELVLKPQVNQENRQKSLSTIEELHRRVTVGNESFEDLAKKYSKDVESAKQGGDLGFARRGSYVPAFEAAAFSLKQGEISDIIETDFGFHVLKLEERRGNLIRVRHILISPEITADDQAMAKRKLDSIRTLIVADSITFLDAVRRFGNKDAISYNNSGKMRNPNTGTSFFETKDLDYDTYFAIEDLKVDSISKVLDAQGMRGDKEYRIIQLQSKTKPHRVSLETDYDKIANYAKENKKATYFSEWMDGVRKRTFVEKDKMFADCKDMEQEIID